MKKTFLIRTTSVAASINAKKKKRKEKKRKKEEKEENRKKKRSKYNTMPLVSTQEDLEHKSVKSEFYQWLT